MPSLDALFPQNPNGIFTLLFMVLLVLIAKATQTEMCSSVSMYVAPIRVLLI
jgi:hypothetical protein